MYCMVSVPVREFVIIGVSVGEQVACTFPYRYITLTWYSPTGTLTIYHVLVVDSVKCTPVMYGRPVASLDA